MMSLQRTACQCVNWVGAPSPSGYLTVSHVPGLLQCEGTTGTEWTELFTLRNFHPNEESQLNAGQVHAKA